MEIANIFNIYPNISKSKLCNLAYTKWNISRSELPELCFQILSTESVVIVTILLSMLIAATFICNFLILMSYFLVSKLRVPSNVLVVNLALTDLLVSIFVLPLAAVYQIKGFWMFNDIVCIVFIMFDVLLCTGSIINLCLIAIDRYLTVTQPLNYNLNRSMPKMIGMASISWMGSVIITFPPLFGWGRNYSDRQCGYSSDLGYQIYATIIAFYIPLIIMFVLYGKIFRVTRTALTNRFQQSVRLSSISKRSQNLRRRNISENQPNSANYDKMIQTLRIRSEKKAIRTLGIIMGCFTICWLPFFVLQLLHSILNSFQIAYRIQSINTLYQIFLWLGYMNSLVNPLIYTKFNNDFRMPIKNLLTCRCTNTQDQLRAQTYSSNQGRYRVSSSPLY